MRAALFYGKEDIRIEQIAEPRCGVDQVKVSPAFAGICGTDLHEFVGGPTFAPVDTPHFVTGEKTPIGFGHEFSGVIAEVGSNSTSLRVGQNVAVQPTICCWKCSSCKAGAENVCDHYGFVGLSGGGGGLSDYVVVPAYTALPLPDNVSLDVGALVEPLAVGYHAVDASRLQKGQTVFIMGGGPIGLAVLQAAKARGAKRVIVSETAPARQRFAGHFGADYVLDPMKEDDIVLKIRDLCSDGTGDGIAKVGADVVFDCAGVPASLKTACHAVKSRGMVVNVAIWEKDVPFNPNWLVAKEASYTCVLGYQKKDFEGIIESLRREAIKPGDMITRKIKLDDLVQEGIMTLINDKENHVKILVDLKAG